MTDLECLDELRLRYSEAALQLRQREARKPPIAVEMLRIERMRLAELKQAGERFAELAGISKGRAA